MLPLDKMTIQPFDQGAVGSIGWREDFPGETFFVGQESSLMIVSVKGTTVTSTEAWNMGGHACFVNDVQFEVDPVSYSQFSNAQNAIGSLIFARSEVRIGTLSPAGRAWTLKIGAANFTGPCEFASAFSRWRAVTTIGGETHCLFERS